MTSKRIGQSRSPELSEVLQALKANIFDTLYVSLPGKVVSYNAATQTADVKPLLKRAVFGDDGTEIQEEVPVLPAVPIVFPRGGGYFLTFPLAADDNVLLLFQDKSIEQFMTSTGTVDLDQVDLRLHNSSDAVAIPGFYPLTKPIVGTLTSDAVFGSEGGVQMRSTGSAMEVTTGGAPASVTGYVAMAALVDLLWTTLDTVLRTAWVPVPNDGGAALKAAYLAAFPTPPSTTASTNLKAD